MASINNKELFINEQIRDKEVRVIDVNGEQLGIMPINRALGVAEDKRLDLVKISSLMPNHLYVRLWITGNIGLTWRKNKKKLAKSRGS